MSLKQDLEIKENEKEALLARIAELEAEKKSRDEVSRISPVNHLEEMRQMRMHGQDESGSIKYKDIHDHRNIRLWHTTGREVGRCLGPIHPANAEQTFERFYAKGIVLSIRRPSDEQVALYKETSQYKALMVKEEARREAKKTLSKENSIDKLTKAITDNANFLKLRPEVSTAK